MRSHGTVEFALLFCSCMAVPAALRAQDLYEYYYYRQLRQLHFDPTRLAAFSSDSSPDVESLRASLEQHGFVVGEIRPIAIPGWNMVELLSAFDDDDASGVANKLADLALDPTTEFVSPVFLGDDGGPVVVLRDLFVRFDSEIVGGVSAEQALIDSHVGEIAERHWAGMERAFRVRSPHASGLEVLADANRLAQLPGVRFAEPDMMFTGGGAHIPDDPGFVNCWGLHNTGQYNGLPDFDMDAPEAWDITIGDEDVIVVVIDVGVQQDHPDIHQIPGTDVTSDASSSGDPVNPFDRHGTAVAGAITATIDNGLGMVGVAPGCVSASARTFISIDEKGRWVTETGWSVDSLVWAESIEARITNNSNFYGFQSSAIADKYQQTRDMGMVHFASAGNSAHPWLEYPASLPSVYGVAAVTNSGAYAPFNSYGKDLDFVAPGDDIFTTDRTGIDGFTIGNYVFLSGTSFSSAYAAGVAALFDSSHVNANAQVVEEGLRLSTVDLGDPGHDDRHGWGMLNAASAVLWDPGCNKTPTPQGKAGGVPRNRYLTFSPGITGRSAAFRVVLIDGPVGFDSLIGERFWVDQPEEVIDSFKEKTFSTVARLSCAPFFRDWGDIDLLNATGPQIVPGAVYAIQAVYEACDAKVEENYSDALILTTARWGDVVAPFNPPDPRTQPDFLDVAGIVDSFRDALGSPELSRADLEPADPNQSVNFSDISSAVDAFKGSMYPFPTPCPCGVPCHLSR